MSRQVHLRYALLALAVALVQFRVVALMFDRLYRMSAEAAWGVLIGEPHWRIYQSRLLGPYLVRAADTVFETFLDAHVFVTVTLLAVAGFLVLVLLDRLLNDRVKVLAGYLVFAFLTTSLLQRPWLYVWDVLDLLVFVVFNYFVLSARDLRWFAALYVVALFNRESAFYIAGWMILEPAVQWWLGRSGKSRRAPDWRMLATGVVLLGGGMAIVEALRGALLVREVGPSIVGEVAGAGPRFHLMLADNLDRLATSLTSFNYAMSFLVPLGMLLFVVFAVQVARRDPERNLANALIHLALLVSLLVFGIVFETRVYLALVPFVVFHLWPLDPPRVAEPSDA